MKTFLEKVLSKSYMLMALLLIALLAGRAGAQPPWNVPSSVLVWYNYTIVNLDSGNAIPAGTALNISVNALAFSANANSGFNNWVAFNGYTGNILYSWLEGNPANEIQTTSLNALYASQTSANVFIWINTDFSIAAGATDTNAFAIGYYSITTNSMNGNNIGEAPQLTCPNPSSSTTTCAYAQYDNGANVFTLYQNFKGTSQPTGWTSVGSAVSINNGVSLSATSGTGINSILTTSTYGLTQGQELDMLGKTASTALSTSDGWEFGGYSNTVTSTCINTDTACNTIGYVFDGITKASSGAEPFVGTSAGGKAETANVLGLGVYAVMQTYWTVTTSSKNSWSYNYKYAGTVAQATSAAKVTIGLSAASSAAGTTTHAIGPFWWFRLVYHPPSNKFPTITNSIAQYPSSGTTCTFTTSNAAVGFGSITAGTTDGTSGSSWNSLLITNTGSTAADIQIDGTSWGWSTPAGDSTSNTVWDWQTGTSFATSNRLKTTQTDTGYSLAGSGTKNIFFGINIPATTPGGTYNQNINIISSC